VKLAVGFPEHEFEFREAASEAFPKETASERIRAYVRKYEDEISAASLRYVCCSCGRFVCAQDISYSHHYLPLIVVVIMRTLGTSVEPVMGQLVVVKFPSSPR
jgi:hypothetical protein